MQSKPLVAIVVPCYNEEEVLNESAQRLMAILNKLKTAQKILDNSFILFVDDGSKDKTWKIIESLADQNKHIKGIKLSRNRGHQIALVAGMEYVVDNCDCVITIDADLQDDPLVIGSFIKEYFKGCDIVYGIRTDRKSDSMFKRITATGFYRFMNLMGVDIVYNHADYRLLSNRALKSLLTFHERNLFLRGLVRLLGYKSGQVFYERKERFAGKSKYTLKKMLELAFDGITSFSITPLRFISIAGFLVFFLSILMSFYIFFITIFTNDVLPGWASTVLPIYFIGGVQLLSLGIIGEYVGKIYTETKKRPLYFIEKEISNEKN